MRIQSEILMRVMRLLFAALGVLFVSTSVSLAQGAPKPADKVDIVGKWSFTVQSEVGNGSPTVTFSSQKGDSISGRYSSQALGEHDFVGTYKDGKIAFGFSAEAGGQTFSMSFAGSVDTA